MKQSIFEASEAVQKWERKILKKKRLFLWFSSNSKVETTWTSLISRPHKASITYWPTLRIHLCSIINPFVIFQVCYIFNENFKEPSNWPIRGIPFNSLPGQNVTSLFWKGQISHQRRVLDKLTLEFPLAALRNFLLVTK